VQRVVGIAPIVMDALQFVDNLHHYYKSFGGWPWSFEPYQSLNLTTNLDSPEFSALMVTALITLHFYLFSWMFHQNPKDSSSEEFL
jgi:PhoPQ-activated pathogenicity-related protein